MASNTETRLHLVDGLHFVGTTPSGHAIGLDSNASHAVPVAATPMELQLVALGGCTAMDTISILRKMRQDITAYDVRLSAERAPEHPRVYTSIVMTHELRGHGISEANVHRAIRLTMTRYCPVFAMLYPKVDIGEGYEITDENTGATVAGDVSMKPGEAAPAAP
jgi:putative redox protein